MGRFCLSPSSPPRVLPLEECLLLEESFDVEWDEFGLYRIGGLTRLFCCLFLVAECVLLTNRSGLLLTDDDSGIGVESYLLGGRFLIGDLERLRIGDFERLLLGFIGCLFP